MWSCRRACTRSARKRRTRRARGRWWFPRRSRWGRRNGFLSSSRSPERGSMPEERNQAERSRPTRLALFANFFKGYMSVATIVAAAIPIPITSWKLIPIYSQQRGFLTVYSSLFCFLLLAFVFSIRHRLAGPMFVRGWVSGLIAALPAVFIALTLGCIVIYHGLMQQSIKEVHELGVVLTITELLDKVDVTEIPYAVELAACYLGIFIF